MRILSDLARLNWQVDENRFGIEVHAPNVIPRAGVSRKEVQDAKRGIRLELAPLRDAQLNAEPTRDFIRRMENPSKAAKHGSILDLVADGREVHGHLAPAMAAQGREREALLQTATLGVSYRNCLLLEVTGYGKLDGEKTNLLLPCHD